MQCCGFAAERDGVVGNEVHGGATSGGGLFFVNSQQDNVVVTIERKFIEEPGTNQRFVAYC
jgi:hypothetical protein